MLELDARQKVFLYLSGVFLTALLIGDTIGSKVFTIDIPLGFMVLPAALSVGSMWFPITFLLTDTINEFYGSKGARFVTFLGFWMAILSFAIIYIARKIPAASFSPVSHATFDNVFGNANMIFLASMVAYLIGQIVDISIFQYAKKLTQSKHIWLRSTGSTLVSQLIDTVLVTYIAFYSKFTGAQLQHMAITSYLVKVILAVGLTPVIYAMHGLIHRKLHIAEHPADIERVHDAVV